MRAAHRLMLAVDQARRPWGLGQSERTWLWLAAKVVRLARRAQGRLAGKPHTIINEARALAGRALTWLALYCLRQSERAANRPGEG